MKKARTLSTVAAVSALTLGAAGVGTTAASAATALRGAKVAHHAHCPERSIGELAVTRDGTGRLTVDVSVDMARHLAGVPWLVRATDSGTVIADRVVRTVGDGSFSVSRVVVAHDGADHVVFVAKDLRTGATCRLNGTV